MRYQKQCRLGWLGVYSDPSRYLLSEKVLTDNHQESKEVLKTSQAAEVGGVGSVSLGYLPGEERPRGQVLGWLDGNANLGHRL